MDLHGSACYFLFLHVRICDGPNVTYATFSFVFLWEMWRWGGGGAESVGRCVCLSLNLASIRREVGSRFVF